MTDNPRLIRKNHSAPADTVIRTIFAHCFNIRDNEDGTRLKTVTEALNLWYDVDTLVLCFDFEPKEYDPDNADAFVSLIHQRTFTKPHIDDISDYSTNINRRCPGLLAVLERADDLWLACYTD